MNYRESDRLPSYRFYRALQRQKSPMRYICEIFGARDFRVFQHNLPQPDMTTAVVEDWFARSSGVSDGIHRGDSMGGGCRLHFGRHSTL
jgi:hypothetical protein